MRDVLNYICEAYRVCIGDVMVDVSCDMLHMLVSAFPQSLHLVTACASVGVSIGHVLIRFT